MNILTFPAFSQFSDYKAVVLQAVCERGSNPTDVQTFLKPPKVHPSPVDTFFDTFKYSQA